MFIYIYLDMQKKELSAKFPSMLFLKKLREERGLSQYGMAKLLGMITGTYVHYEKKAQGIQLNTLVHIKKTLELSWEELGKLIEKEIKEQKTVD
jgi:transcriptional regulator with XRE-family HTH domain